MYTRRDGIDRVYWMPVFAVLEGHLELIVGNATHIRNVPGRKTDVKDAEWIADLVRHGLIKRSFVPPKWQRALRDLVRYHTHASPVRTCVAGRGLAVGAAAVDMDSVKAIELAEGGEPGAVAALGALLMGMRASEIVSRVVRGLDDEGQLLWIPVSKTEAGRRTLQVPDLLRGHLRALAEGKGPEVVLFGHHWRDWVRKWSVGSALPPVFHRCRRMPCGACTRRSRAWGLGRGVIARARVDLDHVAELRETGRGGGGPAAARVDRLQRRTTRLQTAFQKNKTW